MTKKHVIIAFLALFCGLTLWWARSEMGSASPNVMEKLSVLDGFHRETLQGQFFILHFWAKWCGPCAEEIPHLVEFAKVGQFKRPLYVVAVSLDPTLEEAKEILPGRGEGLPANFLLYLDPTHKVADHFGSYQYPESYFIDPNGKIIEKWIGAQKWQRPEVFEFFKQALQ